MAPTPFGNGIYPPCLTTRSEEKSNKACRKKKTPQTSSEASRQPEADVGNLPFFVTYSRSFPRTRRDVVCKVPRMHPFRGCHAMGHYINQTIKCG